MTNYVLHITTTHGRLFRHSLEGGAGIKTFQSNNPTPFLYSSALGGGASEVVLVSLVVTIYVVII